MAQSQVIITGGSRGIGAAIMVHLDSIGFNCVSLSRSGDAPVGKGVACDLRDEASVRRAFAQLGEAGPIIALINNAGLHTDAVSAKISVAEFEDSIRINATGPLVASREAYPYLKASQGTIINIGSFYDKVGVPRNVAYCSAKAALGAITRCLAVEWASDGISVVNIAPGYIATDLNRDFMAKEAIQNWFKKRIPTGQPGKPEDVARVVGALLQANVPFLTGETIYLDGAHGINN